MFLSDYSIALVGVIVAGYILGVSLGTMAYYANEKNY